MVAAVLDGGWRIFGCDALASKGRSEVAGEIFEAVPEGAVTLDRGAYLLGSDRKGTLRGRGRNLRGGSRRCGNAGPRCVSPRFRSERDAQRSREKSSRRFQKVR